MQEDGRLQGEAVVLVRITLHEGEVIETDDDAGLPLVDVDPCCCCCWEEDAAAAPPLCALAGACATRGTAEVSGGPLGRTTPRC